MAGSILALGIWLVLAPAAGECAAKLEMSSLTGPAQCTPDGAKQISDAQLRAKAQCFQECASSYQIAAVDDSANLAVAKPQTQTCTKEGLTVGCSPVALTCAKPFADFPNSCSGVVPLDPGKKDGSGHESVLDTNVLFDAETICHGTYTYDTKSGTCMGLPKGKTTCGKVDTPPEPPKQIGMPAPFPLVPDEEARAVIACFHECAATYTVGWAEGKNWTAALATPKLQKCSNMDVICAPVPLACSKPFGEFPNSCSGVVAMAMPLYVAFYSYAKEVDGKVETILDTQVMVDKDTVCAGLYSVTKGECMGLGLGYQASGVVRPPDPPHVNGMPLAKWPTPNPKGSESSGGGHVVLWIFIVLAVLLMLGLGLFYYRRKRMAEDTARLQEARDVELPQSVNRF
eukprot:Skav230519  [mRNA]  locus=scaffold4943:103944:107044:+ [translate_table: standard]